MNQLTKRLTLWAMSSLAGLSLWAGCLFFCATLHHPAGSIYYLKPDTPRSTLAQTLKEQSITAHTTLFTCWMALHPKTPIKSGEYFFKPNATLYTVWHQLTTGSGFYYRAFTIVPGWTYETLAHALHANPYFSPENITIGQASPEGLFLPETYYFTRDTKASVILSLAQTLMQQYLLAAWEKRAPNLPYHTPYEALIVASLIEKEAKLDAERSIIAGVLMNRLKKGMRLQVDATVIYGLGERYQGVLLKRHLLENNSYNTYQRAGLPPTPIAMPGMLSIEASLHPAQHDYYYYVADGTGGHHFSKTFQEHLAAKHATL